MSSDAGRNLARNTFVLYVRMIIVILINLYASRVILAALGTTDYGIYNVVGGIVSMFTFLNTAMVAASQRFIAFELGKGDTDSSIKVFSTSVIIHLLIAVVVILLSETVGMWFINHKMNVDPARLDAAKWVFHFSVICFGIRIITVPYNASVIAHEKMGVYALASITNAFLLLVSAILLRHVRGDRLIDYSIFLLFAEAINFLIYCRYSKKRFTECRYKKPEDRELFMQMLRFAGWSFVGNFGLAMRGPGVNLVVNMLCGPAINAARGLAYQVSSVVTNFVNNFQTALTPQITKRYAQGERETMMTLVLEGVKISFFLLAIIVVPLYIRAPYVLDLWLEDVPEQTTEFLRLVMIVGLVNSMVGPITTTLQATGRIKVFQIVIAIISLLDVPLAYLLLRQGFPAYTVVFAAIFTETAALIARVFLLNAQMPVRVGRFLQLFVKNALLCALFFVFPVLLDGLFPQTFIGLAGITAVSIIWTGSVFLLIGLNGEERSAILKFIRK